MFHTSEQQHHNLSHFENLGEPVSNDQLSELPFPDEVGKLRLKLSNIGSLCVAAGSRNASVQIYMHALSVRFPAVGQRSSWLFAGFCLRLHTACSHL